MTLHGRSAPLRRILLTVAGVGVALFVAGDILGIRVNLSPSLPRGLYVVTGDPAAKLVEFCPAEPFASLAAERGYRPKGSCPDGAAPLLKPVAAVSGDEVEVTADGLAVNGVPIPNTRPHRADSKHRPLRAWPNGSYLVAPGMVWVASSYNPRSFDSRYFGPVAVRSIRERLRPLLTE